MIPLSVLDLSPVTTAAPAATALRNTLDLSRLADDLGFTRYWLAEHHNALSVASSAPDIMIGQIAAVTRRIRVGAGGVMLRNHAPLMVVERFKTLEALFPGRIDLGIGRAPGADPAASSALRWSRNIAEDDFPERLNELIMFETRGFPEGHAFHSVYAMPTEVPLPPIWLLGSSDYSADHAASVGTGFSFAHHFTSYDAVTAMVAYREKFRSSRWRTKPHAILTVHVVCADTDEESEHLVATSDLNYIRSARGEYLPLSSPEEALAHAYAPGDSERIRTSRARLFVGSPERVYRQLVPLIESTKADELMITTMIYDHGARRRSYELIAKRFGQAMPAGQL